MGKSTKLSVAVAALILGTSLVACDDGRSGAETAAQQFATAVSGLDVAGVAFDGKDAAAANDQLRGVFKALDPQKPAV
ncbi:MAG: penicillin-binding protein, partial [Pseudarthrobacter sp.]